MRWRAGNMVFQKRRLPVCYETSLASGSSPEKDKAEDGADSYNLKVCEPAWPFKSIQVVSFSCPLRTFVIYITNYAIFPSGMDMSACPDMRCNTGVASLSLNLSDHDATPVV